MKRAFTLIELLVVIAVIAILAAIMLPVVHRGYVHCKAWIYGIYQFHDGRIDAFCEDNDARQMAYATNQPKRLTIYPNLKMVYDQPPRERK